MGKVGREPIPNTPTVPGGSPSQSKQPVEVWCSTAMVEGDRDGVERQRQRIWRCKSWNIERWDEKTGKGGSFMMTEVHCWIWRHQAVVVVRPFPFASLSLALQRGRESVSCVGKYPTGMGNCFQGTAGRTSQPRSSAWPISMQRKYLTQLFLEKERIRGEVKDGGPWCSARCRTRRKRSG